MIETKEIYRNSLNLVDVNYILPMVYRYAREQFNKGKKGYVLITKDHKDLIAESFEGELFDVGKVSSFIINEFVRAVPFDFTNKPTEYGI